MYIISWHGNVVMGNQILNNSVGITVNIETVQDYMYQFRENIILNNTFENAQNAVNKAEGVIYEPLSNAWDDGEAGNYWSDYNGTDADGDGVGDTPYVIDNLNQDNFPLMAPVVIPAVPVELPELPAAPSVVLLNPANATYSDASVSLDFVVDKQAAWMSYSLDGQDNVTVAGNVTFAGLSDGAHTLTVYANNTYGFTGASETVTFTIATFPTTLVAASIILAAIIGAGLLVYFKKQGSKKILK